MAGVADRIQERCGGLIPWSWEEQAALPVDEAEAILRSALDVDLRRIGDVRADQLIAAALRIGHEYYLEAQDGNPDDDVEGEAHAVAGGERWRLAETAKSEIAVALGRGAKARRREASYIAAVCIAGLRER
jgi:hypothetical protein